MNVNKKLGRFKQWAGEKMGGDAKTDTSEDFKALEIEMNLRHEGTYPAVITYVFARSLTLSRHGEAPKVHDTLHQVHLAQGSRRTREDATGSIPRFHHDQPRTRLPT